MFTNIYEGEIAIQNMIKNDNNCSAHFNYEVNHSTLLVTLELVTYNPAHKAAFLLHTVEAGNNCKAINKIYEYLYNLKTTLKSKNDPYLSYTLEWYNSTAKKNEISYFGGENMEEILRKFYYGKLKTTKIFNIKLNPIS